jgi:hypothetical protein
VRIGGHVMQLPTCQGAHAFPELEPVLARAERPVRALPWRIAQSANELPGAGPPQRERTEFNRPPPRLMDALDPTGAIVKGGTRRTHSGHGPSDPGGISHGGIVSTRTSTRRSGLSAGVTVLAPRNVSGLTDAFSTVV